MDIRVQGTGPSAPFLSARDRFETAHDLALPVTVRLREDPDERTWAGHYDDRHVLNISKRAATSALATELALHEFAHMARYEEAHPSHVQSTDEVVYLALAGRSVERRKLSHVYQIANHMKDIYADDITLSVGPGEKLLAYLESAVAAAIADRPAPVGAARRRISSGADPEITAVNAAFALALAQRHDLLVDDHRLYDLAETAAIDAPTVDLEHFRRHFRDLDPDTDRRTYKQDLVDAVRAYVLSDDRGGDTLDERGGDTPAERRGDTPNASD